MPISDLNLVKAHEQCCLAQFSILEAVKLCRDYPDDSQARDSMSNALGSVGEAIRYAQGALEHLRTERDDLASQLQTSHSYTS